MKTVEEKARDASCDYGINDIQHRTMFASGYLQGYNDAMGCQSNPKIKQLEWEEYENRLGRKSYFAKTQFSPYEVADAGGHYIMYSPDKRLRFASTDKAKAAAQADFEARIKECLITE